MPRRQSDRAKKALKRHAASVRSRQEVGSSDRRSWPVVRAYVPVEDCFRATGCGTAGVLRRAPDGSLTSAFFTIELIRGGLMGAFGKNGTDDAETEAALRTMGASIPSLEPGSVDLAARYIWGAYAWSLERGRRWPTGMRKRYLDVAPLPDGTADSWLQQFAGPNGLLPPKLVEIARRNTSALDDIPGRPGSAHLHHDHVRPGRCGRRRPEAAEVVARLCGRGLGGRHGAVRLDKGVSQGSLEPTESVRRATEPGFGGDLQGRCADRAGEEALDGPMARLW